MPADELLERHNDALLPGDFDERLTAVFEATFPDLAPDAIPTASAEALEEWDSLQAVVLMTLLEEEFGISIPPVDLPELDSYASVSGYVARAQPA